MFDISVCFVKTVTTKTIQAAEGQQSITIPCSLAATLPAFTGPVDIPYTNEDDSTFNPALPASLRARLAIVNGDLVISNVESGDAGIYRCSYIGQGQSDSILEVGEYRVCYQNKDLKTVNKELRKDIIYCSTKV